MKRVTARVAAIAVLGAGALAASAAPAAAQPKPTPNEQCGARNMMNEHAAPHMVEAMALHTNEHGDAGMVAAVIRTRCR